MPLQRLSPEQLSGGRAAVHPKVAEYAEFLKGTPVGHGGKAIVSDEGVSRQSVKARLRAAAAICGVDLKFRRAPDDEVSFEVVSALNAPKRRGRKPKAG